MNFINTFDELNKLYEEMPAAKKEAEKLEDADIKEELTEAAEDEEIEIIDDEPKQVIIECSKCGALVIVDEADIKVDEESDLVNVETECKFCEEKEGYKIIGSLVPYETADVEVDEDEIEEPIEEGLFDRFKKPVTWSKLKGTHTVEVVELQNFKKGDLINSTDNPKHLDDSDEFETIISITKKGTEPDDTYFVVKTNGSGAQDDPTEKYLRAIPKGNKETVEEGLFDKFKNKDIKKETNAGVLNYKDYEEYYTLDSKEAKNIGVGDYVATSGNAQLGNLKLELVNHVQRIPGNKILIRCAQSEFHKDIDAVVSVLATSDVPNMKEDYKTIGSHEKYISGSTTEDAGDEALTENFVDKVRKALNLPAPMVVQLIWEAMLNNEFGEISPELRADLEQAFAQQRDWEKRRDEKQAAKAAKKAAKADKKANKLAKEEDLEELFNANIKVDARGFGGSGNAVDII